MVRNPIIATCLSIIFFSFLQIVAFLYLFKIIDIKKIILAVFIVPFFLVFAAFMNDYLSALNLSFTILNIFVYNFFVDKKEKSSFLLCKVLILNLIYKIMSFSLFFPFNYSQNYWIHSFMPANFFIYLIIIFVSKEFFVFLTNKFHAEIYELSKSRGIIFTLVVLTFIHDFYYIFIQSKGNYNALILITLVVNIIILFSAFFVFAKTQQYYLKRLEKEKLKNEMDALLSYTQLLEQSHLNLRKFQHDYKNILLAISGIASDRNWETLDHYLQELEIYSITNLEQDADKFGDIKNVEHPLLKSVLLTKLIAMDQKNIQFRFECTNRIDYIAIHDFDLVRLISIFMDNAIEYLKEQPNGMFSMCIIDDNKKTQVIIKNTLNNDKIPLEKCLQVEYSSKLNHAGLGFKNAGDIVDGYNNMAIHYTKSEEFIF
ncbi:GHKL domain-containing protein [Facklamia sp. 7083-14-GEN3]|uniref:GHKL domain-containing protein n=1 Tax=Facklamia sp. 7083-14-GEN3 TaxID=2973478 RepID=UPI00215CC6EB|nr:GHKL domain-containing protein [Facklamia sp. 7083-14-GEN3]MCR8969738.1 GHKL domain-containing protein [Facklamia sp. 7083-14-GEN3]